MQTRNKQQGFTLVEIAIVLVIIGLLLGGVLKGQELIKSAKIKAAAADVSAYSVALISYEDRYGNLFNGDNHIATITGDPDSADMLAELAARGFISVKLNHALGGLITLQKNGDATGTVVDLALAAGSTPERFNWAVCYADISTEEDVKALIRAIDGADTVFNDGYTNGRARLVVNDTFIAATEYDAANTTVCFEL